MIKIKCQIFNPAEHRTGGKRAKSPSICLSKQGQIYFNQKGAELLEDCTRMVVGFDSSQKIIGFYSLHNGEDNAKTLAISRPKTRKGAMVTSRAFIEVSGITPLLESHSLSLPLYKGKDIENVPLLYAVIQK